MEKYSVLMSLYKKEKPDFLRQSIESMINQTIMPDEIVIVKDGPLTPKLEQVLKEYQTSHPTLFNIVVSENNVGLGLALNLGLKLCRNELVARMDTDDISLPERCEKQLSVFKSEPEIAIVGAFVSEFNTSSFSVVSTRKVPTSHPEIYEFAKKRSAFNHPVVMYRKSKVIEVGGYANLRRNQDVDLFGRMLFTGCKAKNIDEALLMFRINDDLAKRRKSWGGNTKSYISTINKFRKIGYSSTWDVLMVAVAQTAMFLAPLRLQHFIYKKFLRE
ncbi:glycosyltransferase [Gracilibacillus boraciitolerans JCM 21714]|uniref:Glycosyltransferase n=1 Tax=Gracilibacillus boraciitolerans JCM 21714 TaxID=1298598 RepID=W4VQM9_9BACI|nr:glycosyltransferase [Gracilibacillus boraciitolerans]GAE95218.1 glycosyltransferase [Gracilibacillus boraciitolerans JCM 21714]